MNKKDKNSGFQTHIPEPRWQQVASVIIVLLGIAIWLWSATKH
jgi:hypothetical protein